MCPELVFPGRRVATATPELARRRRPVGRGRVEVSLQGPLAGEPRAGGVPAVEAGGRVSVSPVLSAKDRKQRLAGCLLLKGAASTELTVDLQRVRKTRRRGGSGVCAQRRSGPPVRQRIRSSRVSVRRSWVGAASRGMKVLEITMSGGRPKPRTRRS